MTLAKMIIEVDCEYRNNVGACSTSSGSFSFHCLHCPLGHDWISKHVTIVAEDTRWGRDAENMIKKSEIKRTGLLAFLKQ
jgi:hypothetical protein